MGESLLQLWQTARGWLEQFLASLSPQQKSFLFRGGPVLIVGLFVGWYLLQRITYRPLFSDLSPQDAAAVVRELDGQQIPYILSKGGSVIEVPKEVLYRTRVNLAGQGLPMGGGVGLEVFAETPFGMSEFSQRVNYLRALQGELTRTINALSAVRSSRVHLALPRRSSTLLDRREHATASVVVSLRPGYWLTPGQVHGITHLVASSVTGLAPEHVTIVDSSGQTLLPVGEKTDRTESERMHDLKVQIEQKLESRIQSMLEPVLGPGRAIARATVELDFQQRQQTTEEFDPAGQVVRSQQREVEEAATPPGGVPGVQANIPGGDSERLQQAKARKSSHITNYDISKTTSQVTAPRGQVRRLSVAVLVDGKYENGAYIPRSAEEMETLKAVVMRAVGFNADRGDQLEVANIPFSEKPLLLEYAPFDAREWITTLEGIGTVAGVLGLLIVLIMLNSMRRRRRVAAELQVEQTQPAASLEQGQQGADSAEVTGMAGERITIEEDPRRAEIIRLAQENKEFAVQIIRMWLQAEKRAKAVAQGAQGAHVAQAEQAVQAAQGAQGERGEQE